MAQWQIKFIDHTNYYEAKKVIIPTFLSTDIGFLKFAAPSLNVLFPILALSNLEGVSQNVNKLASRDPDETEPD